jgi:hypothetical protein
MGNNLCHNKEGSMSSGAWMMVLTMVLTFGSLGFLLFALVRSVQNEKSKDRGVWRQFGLGLSLMILFFVTWIAHGISQWQTFTDEARSHGEQVQVGDFFTQFSESTLENWQSEFLQLFSFVVLAALLMHKGSAESKDGTEKIEASLRRLEEKMGTLPKDAPKKKSESWKLPDTPEKLAG